MAGSGGKGREGRRIAPVRGVVVATHGNGNRLCMWSDEYRKDFERQGCLWDPTLRSRSASGQTAVLVLRHGKKRKEKKR